MGTWVRRFLVMGALMYWQGGFTFYIAIVIPVGREVLGSHLQQAMITRHVTSHLNLAGAVALLIFAWDLIRRPDREKWLRWGRWLAWAGMFAMLIYLIWHHARLDEMIDPEAVRVRDRPTFRIEHRLYLWGSTFQWFCALVFLGLTLVSWRRADREVSRTE